MADQSEQMNMLLRNQTGAAMSPDRMVAKKQLDDYIISGQGQEDLTSDLVKQFPNEADAFRKATRSESGSAVSDSELKAFMDEQLNMIGAAQMGLMEMDPEGTKDVVQGLEMTKQKVMSGSALTEGESSGIMAILQKLGGALSGMMGGGADQPMQQVMVDGNVTMLTAKDIMSAKNAGMLVQPVGEAIRDMEMNQ